MRKNIFILLGSNLGNRKAFLAQARQAIKQQCGEILASSHLYETAPWGFESEDWFLNQVIEIDPDYSADQLLDRLLAIETSLGRTRTTAQYSSRIIDIDLLYFGNQVFNSAKLVVPHPRLQMRKFTLLPLCEIAPEFIHPVLQKSQLELLQQVSDESVVRRLDNAAD
ncbi:MAG: 2-amino-4-hydroxy-6-hydroxymethyldihydropteridine diphosphokinase [Bacteroidales bacterium]|nr:2-amino-4-hydroxy-6-hydroxymethyldihydropteridine diphosphokinase [Bacteroidales bacterium]